MIDEELCGFEKDFGLARLRVRDATKEKRGLLGLHHHKFDKLLGQFARVRGGLNFSHGQDCGGRDWLAAVFSGGLTITSTREGVSKYFAATRRTSSIVTDSTCVLRLR